MAFITLLKGGYYNAKISCSINYFAYLDNFNLRYERGSPVVELKNCECGQQVEFSWSEKCETCSIKYCECGQQTKSKWLDTCSDCYDKQHRKDLIKLVVGVFVGLIVLSLFVATILKYEKQIDSFFTGIEVWTISYFNSLSSFTQDFLFTLGASSLVLFLIFMMGIVLSTSSNRY